MILTAARRREPFAESRGAHGRPPPEGPVRICLRPLRRLRSLLVSSLRLSRISNRGSYGALTRIRDTAEWSRHHTYRPHVRVGGSCGSRIPRTPRNALTCMLHRTSSGVRMQARACRVQSLGLSAYICCIYLVSQSIQSTKGPTACVECMQAHFVTTQKQGGGVWTAEVYAWT